MRFLKTLVVFFFAAGGMAYATQIVVDTGSLSNWSPIPLPLVSRPTNYSVVTADGAKAIAIESEDGASGLVYDHVFNIYATPVLHWSWEALNVLTKGNAKTRQGDDYAVRIYVMFPYDGSRLSLLERIRSETVRRLLGYYPPSEILTYAWANRPQPRQPLPNAFSDRGAMFFPDAGTAHLGQWRSHTANLLDDFRKAFGTDPQKTFRVAIMGDSDNTHEQTKAYIRDITLSSD